MKVYYAAVAAKHIDYAGARAAAAAINSKLNASGQNAVVDGDRFDSAYRAVEAEIASCHPSITSDLTIICVDFESEEE